MLKENLKKNLSVLAIRYLGFDMLFELLFQEVEAPAHTLDCGCWMWTLHLDVHHIFHANDEL